MKRPYIVCHMMQSVDGRIGQPALFDGISDKKDFLPVKLTFQDVKALPNGVIWARYYVNNK